MSDRPDRSNPACVGKVYPTKTKLISPEVAQAYADATGDENPVYNEKYAPPMAVVAASIPLGVAVAAFDEELLVDKKRLLRLLHGEEEIRWHRVIPHGTELAVTAKVASINAKSSGELIVIETELKAKDQLVAECRSGLFIRAAKKADGAAPAQPKPKPERTDERPEPNLQVSWTVAPDQSKRYAEVSGDRNPIHLDQSVAKSAGLGGIILHGLCTMAFAQWAVIREAADNDPRRLHRLRVRFSKPVLMGDTLRCVAWKKEGGGPSYGFEVVNQEGSRIIQQGEADFGDPLMEVGQ